MSLMLGRIGPMQFLDEPLTAGTGVRLLQLRRYRPGEEHDIALRADFRAALDAAGGVLPGGPRWTVAHWDSGWPVAVGGLEPLPHVGEGAFGCWALTSDLPLRDWAFARRCARRVLEFAERELKAREIHAMARDTPGAVQLLQALGFARNGPTWPGPDEAFYIPMVRRFGGSV